MSYIEIDATTYGYQLINAAGTAGYYFYLLMGFSAARNWEVEIHILRQLWEDISLSYCY